LGKNTTTGYSFTRGIMRNPFYLLDGFFIRGSSISVSRKKKKLRGKQQFPPQTRGEQRGKMSTQKGKGGTLYFRHHGDEQPRLRKTASAGRRGKGRTPGGLKRNSFTTERTWSEEGR